MFNINQSAPIYDPETVQPMRDELIHVGFEEATTPQKVEEILSSKNNEAILVLINSVCGCAAGSARPGVTLALQHKIIPDKLVTVFAGQDRDAIEYLREKYLSKFPPTSPMMAIFKNSEVIFIMHRQHIEGRGPEEIASDLIAAFEKFCNRQGPSISAEKYAELIHAKVCGSRILANNN